jgi:hypothetical protein
VKGQLGVTTPEEYLAKLDEPRKGEIEHIHNFIRATVPDLQPYILNGMLAYGTYHYKYESGREGDWCVIGLASNKNYISIYACGTDEQGYVAERYKSKLPKASIGKSCVRFKKFSDLDEAVVVDLLRETAKAQIEA